MMSNLNQHQRPEKDLQGLVHQANRRPEEDPLRRRESRDSLLLEKEKRVARDGYAYTRKEFEEFYDTRWKKYWDSAEKGDKPVAKEETSLCFYNITCELSTTWEQPDAYKLEKTQKKC